MPFYAFRLDTIHVLNPRGKIPDDDVVTFNVFVNQIDRGHGTGFFTDLGAGSVIGAAAVTPNNRLNMGVDWIVGPLELAPTDGVSIVYSGMNTSDNDNISLDTQQQDQIELGILNAILTGAVGAIPIAGPAIAGVLGAIGDPVGKFLGYSPQGPCNGLVFSDSVQLTGGGLATLPYQPDTSFQPLPPATAASFTRAYDDSATHNDAVCGEVAHTQITFSVLQLPWVSVRGMAQRLFPAANLTQGLRHATGSTASSLRALIGLG
jgi:hypothetical protein